MVCILGSMPRPAAPKKIAPPPALVTSEKFDMPLENHAKETPAAAMSCLLDETWDGKSAESSSDGAKAAADDERRVINNVKAMDDMLLDFAYDKKMPFIECPAVTPAAKLEIEDHNDDLKRELEFQKSALAAVCAARKLILKAGVSFARPDDYFAEMVKSDAHMNRVRSRLAEESEQLARSEEARRMRMQRKFGKQVQQNVLEERRLKAKELTNKVAALKKRNKASSDDKFTGISAEDDHDATDFENQLDFDDFDVTTHTQENESSYSSDAKKQQRRGGGSFERGAAARSQNQRGGTSSSTFKNSKKSGGAFGSESKDRNSKRQFKDKKFGFGGKKRGLKRNTADSCSEAYGGGKSKGNARGGGAGKSGRGGASGGGNFSKRPGPNRRRQMATKKGSRN